MNTASERRDLLAKTFAEQFGTTPEVWARAPGRVDLMGSHTDYNLGYILTLPIGLDLWVAARPQAGRTVRLYSTNLKTGTVFSLDHLAHDAQHPWSNYARGVASELAGEGLPLHGFDGVIHSTVPMASGLSSSAALECALATVFEALGGWRLDPARKALICQRAENRFVGVNCGILDQYTACAGREGCALLLDCSDLSSRPVRLADGIKVVICDTKSKRELAGSEYGTRRAQCEDGARRLGAHALRQVSLADFQSRRRLLPPEVAKRCQFILEENERVLRLAEALTAGERLRIRQLCEESFKGAADLYEIVSMPMRSMMEAMLSAPGVIGARQAGAGFGGCMVALVEAGQTSPFGEWVRARYAHASKVQPEVYPVQAAAGAGLI